MHRVSHIHALNDALRFGDEVAERRAKQLAVVHRITLGQLLANRDAVELARLLCVRQSECDTGRLALERRLGERGRLLL